MGKNSNGGADKAPTDTADSTTNAPTGPVKIESAGPIDQPNSDAPSGESEQQSSDETPPTGDDTIAGDAPPVDEPTDEVIETPAVEEAPAPPAPPAPNPGGSEMTASQSVRPKNNDADSTVIELIKNRLEEYATNMAVARPITPDLGGRQQKNLLHTLKMAMRLEGRAFNDGWNTVLKVAAEHRKGAFSEKYVMRFLEKAVSGLAPEEIRSFMDVVHLIINTAEPSSRQLALKHVSIETVAAHFHIDNLNDKFVGFYNL